MAEIRSLRDVSVGDELPTASMPVTRADLIRYAGASLDFNKIHWDEPTAMEVGLPDVIAHGMLTMALVGRVITDWAGDPGALVRYQTKFTRPVVVPNDGVGATVTVSGRVVGRDETDGTVRVEMTAMFDGKTVLGRPTAVVRLR
jgi:acyl dehydratase